jgi:hypothetical protein
VRKYYCSGGVKTPRIGRLRRGIVYRLGFYLPKFRKYIAELNWNKRVNSSTRKAGEY